MHTSNMPRRQDACGDSFGDVVAVGFGAGPGLAPDAAYERTRRVWSAGAYERISAGFRHEAEAFVARLNLRPGHRVLDAACGSGNLTLPAARAGATVAGLDIVPQLLDIGRDRAGREGLSIAWREGTVEALPYADAAFDVAISMFGVAFAARPRLVADELARVVRPGGRLALANWTAEGFVGRMLSLHHEAMPPAAGAASPLAWGDEAALRQLFTEDHWAIETRRRVLRFRYPHTPRGTAELFRAAYGPTIVTSAAVDEDHRAQLHAALTTHWERHALGSGAPTEVDAEYLELRATRR